MSKPSPSNSSNNILTEQVSASTIAQINSTINTNSTHHAPLLYPQGVDYFVTSSSPMPPTAASSNYPHPLTMFPPIASTASLPSSTVHILPQPQPVMSGMLQQTATPSYLPPSSSIAYSPYSTSAPDFMFLLKKILSDENDSIISWSNGFVCIHDPQSLATKILPKYFRHSNFSSFQRQLNYFGFRKVSGKGKIVPCTYHNDCTTTDLNSLLQIKKKPKTTSRRRINKNVSSNESPRKKEILNDPTQVPPTTNVNPPMSMDNVSPLTVGSIPPKLFNQFSLPANNQNEGEVPTVDNSLICNNTGNQGNLNETDFYSNFPPAIAAIFHNSLQQTPSTALPDVNYSFNPVNFHVTNNSTPMNGVNQQQQQIYHVYNPSVNAPPQTPIAATFSDMKQLSQNISNNLQGVSSNPYSSITTDATSFCVNNNDMPSFNTTDTSSSYGSNDISSNSMNRTFSLTDLAMIPTLQDNNSSLSTKSFTKHNRNETDGTCYFTYEDDFPQCEPVTVNDIIKVIIG